MCQCCKTSEVLGNSLKHVLAGVARSMPSILLNADGAEPSGCNSTPWKASWPCSKTTVLLQSSFAKFLTSSAQARIWCRTSSATHRLSCRDCISTTGGWVRCGWTTGWTSGCWTTGCWATGCWTWGCTTGCCTTGCACGCIIGCCTCGCTSGCWICGWICWTCCTCGWTCGCTCGWRTGDVCGRTTCVAMAARVAWDASEQTSDWWPGKDEKIFTKPACWLQHFQQGKLANFNKKLYFFRGPNRPTPLVQAAEARCWPCHNRSSNSSSP